MKNWRIEIIILVRIGGIHKMKIKIQNLLGQIQILSKRILIVI